MILLITLSFGIIFGILASMSAFLITYNEYQKHHLAKQRLLIVSLQSAIVTLIFFIVSSLLIGYLLTKYIL
jgi:uncharacterized membrane protein